MPLRLRLLSCKIEILVRVLAWLQIIPAVCTILAGVVFLVLVLYNYSDYTTFGVVFSVGIIFIGMCLLVLFMGLLLLRGVNERNSMYLDVWIVYAITCGSANTLWKFLVIAIGKSTHLSIDITILVTGICLGSAVILFVYFFMRKVQKEMVDNEEENDVGSFLLLH